MTTVYEYEIPAQKGYTHKTKGTFWGAKRAIRAFKTLSDQLDPFWLSWESHSGELIDPKQLHLQTYQIVHNGMYEMVPRGAKMALGREPYVCI